jgi:hypothetical protein
MLMHKITDTVDGVSRVKVGLNLEEHTNFYEYSMIEITHENGNKNPTVQICNKSLGLDSAEMFSVPTHEGRQSFCCQL